MVTKTTHIEYVIAMRNYDIRVHICDNVLRDIVHGIHMYRESLYRKTIELLIYSKGYYNQRTDCYLYFRIVNSL